MSAQQQSQHGAQRGAAVVRVSLLSTYYVVGPQVEQRFRHTAQTATLHDTQQAFTVPTVAMA